MPHDLCGVHDVWTISRRFTKRFTGIESPGQLDCRAHVQPLSQRAGMSLISSVACCVQVQFPRFTPPQSVFANTAVEAALGLIFETEPASSTETARGIGDRPTGIEGCPDRESGNAGQMQSEEDDQPASAACISQLVREAGDALQWLRKRGTKQWNVNGRQLRQSSGCETAFVGGVAVRL